MGGGRRRQLDGRQWPFALILTLTPILTLAITHTLNLDPSQILGQDSEPCVYSQKYPTDSLDCCKPAWMCA